MKRIISILLIFIITCMGFSGCYREKGVDEYLKKGYFEVRYDFNGGKIESSTHKSIYVKKDSLLPLPGDDYKNFPNPSKQGFQVDGWYIGEKDDNGNVIFNEEWNFSEDKATTGLILFAKWKLNQTFTVWYGKDDLESKVFGISDNGTIEQPKTPPAWTGHTLLEYYKDREKTEVFTFGETFPEGEQNVDIYTEWLVGDFILVKDASDIRAVYATTNLYLLDDIDFSGKKLTFPSEYKGQIIGNGKKIMNLNISQKQSGTTDNSFAMFKKLTGAKIENVIFKSCTYSVEIGISTPTNIAFFIGFADKNTVVTNVLIEDCTLEIINKSSIIPTVSDVYSVKENGAIIECTIDNLIKK